MQTLYAVGDIHGDINQLRSIHARISADARHYNRDDHLIIHIGDLVDRREDSKAVVDYLMQGQDSGQPWIVLKGNHDRMMTLFIERKEQDPVLRKDLTWLHPRLGGLTTLESYGITGYTHEQETELQAEALAKVPAAHLQYLNNLPDHYDTPNAYFAHAGVKPGIPLTDQVEDDLIWIRAPFHEHTSAYEKLVIHGHTPVDVVTHYGNRINIDTGAAYGKVLSAIVLDESGAWDLKADGRAEIHRETT